METDTYSASLKCGNCKQSVTVSISKGTPIMQYCSLATCSNCGCKELRESKDYAVNPKEKMPHKDTIWICNTEPDYML